MIEKKYSRIASSTSFIKRRIIILSYLYAGRYSIDRSDWVGSERRQRALNVRGERVGHEIARSVRVRVGGHTVVFLHLLAHGIERLGGDQAAFLVNLSSDLVRRARIDVVVAATGRGARVQGDFARGEGGRATRGARERREDAVHEAGAAREIVRIVVDDVEHLAPHDDGRVVLHRESAAETITHGGTAGGVHGVDFVSLTDLGIRAVFPVVLALLRGGQRAHGGDVVAVESVISGGAGEKFAACRVQLVVLTRRLVLRTQVVVRVHVLQPAHGIVVDDRGRGLQAGAVRGRDVSRRLRLSVGTLKLGRRGRGCGRGGVPLILQSRVRDTDRERGADERADRGQGEGLGERVRCSALFGAGFNDRGHVYGRVCVLRYRSGVWSRFRATELSRRRTRACGIVSALLSNRGKRGDV